MSLMNDITRDSMDLWQAAADEPFLEELGKGTLPRDRFLDYIVQDSIYLRDYMKAFAMGMFRSPTLRDMQFFLQESEVICSRAFDVHPTIRNPVLFFNKAVFAIKILSHNAVLLKCKFKLSG